MFFSLFVVLFVHCLDALFWYYILMVLIIGCSGHEMLVSLLCLWGFCLVYATYASTLKCPPMSPHSRRQCTHLCNSDFPNKLDNVFFH